MAKKSLKQIASNYDQELIRKQKEAQAKIEASINKVIDDITAIAANESLPSGVFDLTKLPLLNNFIDRRISQLARSINSEIVNGINGAWELSNKKNNIFADIRIDKSIIPTDAKVTFYDTNSPALSAFKNRQIEGLNLSQRIYKTGEQLKGELEAGLGLGISKGQSAASMSRDLKQYLKDPDKLFRRVRDEEGNLQLSKNAKSFNPGQGVYRSSFKNINRLTRTETNMAYRQADMLRYDQTPFILGYEVRLSAQHPRFDICDLMAGEYPSTFNFIGWHPQCLCYTVPILMNNEQFAAYQKLVLSGHDTPENVKKIAARISDIPDSAKTWITDNAEKVSGWKKPPLWWQQNEEFVPDISKIIKAD